MVEPIWRRRTRAEPDRCGNYRESCEQDELSQTVGPVIIRVVEALLALVYDCRTRRRDGWCGAGASPAYGALRYDRVSAYSSPSRRLAALR